MCLNDQKTSWAKSNCYRPHLLFTWITKKTLFHLSFKNFVRNILSLLLEVWAVTSTKFIGNLNTDKEEPSLKVIFFCRLKSIQNSKYCLLIGCNWNLNDKHGKKDDFLNICRSSLRNCIVTTSVAHYYWFQNLEKCWCYRKFIFRTLPYLKKFVTKFHLRLLPLRIWFRTFCV